MVAAGTACVVFAEVCAPIASAVAEETGGAELAAELPELVAEELPKAIDYALAG